MKASALPPTRTGPIPGRISEKSDAMYTVKPDFCQSQNSGTVRGSGGLWQATSRARLTRVHDRRSHDPDVLGREEQDEPQRRSGGADDDARPVERSAPGAVENIDEGAALHERRYEGDE